jgi:hypothetical protein
MSDDLRYVTEGTRGELARFADALRAAGIAPVIRPKDGCPPSA